MSTLSKLKSELTVLLPGYKVEVDETEDETLPPYRIDATKDDVTKRVYASEPVATNIANEVTK